jgi:hypothetical protein
MFTLFSFQRYGKDQIMSLCQEGQDLFFAVSVLFYYNSIRFIAEQIMIVLIVLCLLKINNSIFISFI